MKMDVRHEKKLLIVTLSGRLDAVTVPDFDKRCETLTHQDEPRIVLDLGQLEYISSAGLRGLLMLAKRCKAGSGALMLANVTGLVGEVISVSGFDSFLPIYDSVAKVMAEEA